MYKKVKGHAIIKSQSVRPFRSTQELENASFPMYWSCFKSQKGHIPCRPLGLHVLLNLDDDMCDVKSRQCWATHLNCTNIPETNIRTTNAKYSWSPLNAERQRRKQQQQATVVTSPKTIIDLKQRTFGASLAPTATNLPTHSLRHCSTS